MTEKQIARKLKKIRSNMRWCDDLLGFDWSDKETRTVTKKQAEVVEELLELMKDLNWQIALNSYKRIKFNHKRHSIEPKECGTPVKVRPCKKEYGDKTYFGILLGDVALSMSASIKKDVLTVSPSFHNPAIFVPELKTIIYGMESWWGRIESKEDFDKLITDDTIQNCWYVKMLQELIKEKPEEKDGQDSATA